MTHAIPPRAIALIQSSEQCRLTAYMPTAHDVPTIGFGSTGPDIHLGMTWTQAQADARFAADLGRFADSVAGLIGDAPTTPCQFGAMCSLAYNIGAHAFSGSTVLRKHKAGDHAGAAVGFGLWNKQAGTVLRGLTIRRAREASLYLTGDWA